MKPERKIKIAESFSNKYAETELDIYLSQKEFKLLDRGIFAGSMDEKWNIFIHNDSLFFARSWTDNCIYKADLETKRCGIKLNKLKITRNTDEYKEIDLKSDTELFKKLLQIKILHTFRSRIPIGCITVIYNWPLRGSIVFIKNNIDAHI